MYHLRKLRGFSLVALLVVMPSLSFANTVVTSQTYVDIQDALDEKLSNKLNGTSTSGQKIGDLAAGSAAGQDQVMYPSAAAVKEYSVAKNQGVGTNNANVGKTLVVNSSGVLELGSIDALPSGASNQVLQHNGSAWVSTTMDTTPTASSNKPVTSGGVKTYVDGKVSSGASVSSTSTTTAPNEQAVYNAIANHSAAGAEVNVQANWTEADSTSDAYILNKPTLGAAASKGVDTTIDSDSTDADVATAKAVYDAVHTAQSATTYHADGTTITLNTQTNTFSATSGSVQSGNTGLINGGQVYTALADKQTKPSSGVASGKVLTYTGTDANANVSAAYVSIPVSSGAPSTNTPTSFAEVWVQ